MIGGWYFLASVVPAYLTGGIESGEKFLEPLATAALRTLQATGESLLLQAVAVFAVVAGFFERRTRAIAIFVLGIVLVVMALALWRDPVSGLITTPYYRQPERVRYLLLFFVPALMGCGLVWGWGRIRADAWPAAVRRTVLVAGVLALLAPDLPGIVQRYQGQRAYAPFSTDDFRHARQIAEIVAPDE